MSVAADVRWQISTLAVLQLKVVPREAPSVQEARSCNSECALADGRQKEHCAACRNLKARAR